MVVTAGGVTRIFNGHSLQEAEFFIIIPITARIALKLPGSLGTQVIVFSTSSRDLVLARIHPLLPPYDGTSEVLASGRYVRTHLYSIARILASRTIYYSYYFCKDGFTSGLYNKIGI